MCARTMQNTRVSARGMNWHDDQNFVSSVAEALSRHAVTQRFVTLEKRRVVTLPENFRYVQKTYNLHHMTIAAL